MDFAYDGEPRQYTTTIQLQQQGRTLTGTWQGTRVMGLTGDIRGTLTGEGETTTFDGAITWISDTSTGTGRCLGTATFHGTAVPPAMTWMAPKWDWGATCFNGSGPVSWTVIRF